MKSATPIKKEPMLDVIARMHTPYPVKFGVPRQPGLVMSLPSRIVFEPTYRDPDYCRGIEGFDYLWLIWSFSHNEGRAQGATTVRPPRLGGTRRVGVFASRSSFRPNDLGLSSVRLLGVERDEELGTVLVVQGADMVDGTPVYDIKPYLPFTDSHVEASSGWVDHNDWQELDVHIDTDLLQQIPLELRAGCEELLRQDPRPAYTRTTQPDREFWVPVRDVVIWFVVCGNRLDVTRVRTLDAKEYERLKATGTI